MKHVSNVATDFSG